MRIKHLSLIILAAAAFASCSKDSVKPISATTVNTTTIPATNTVSYAVEGKWQQTKLEMYLLDPTGKKLYDTTYSQPFTGNDFVQFFDNSTCTFSISHYFYLNEPGTWTTPTPISPLVSNYDYKSDGSHFLLTTPTPVMAPAGVTSADTVYTPNANTVLVRGVSTTLGPNLFVSDSYYTKVSGSSQQ